MGGLSSFSLSFFFFTSLFLLSYSQLTPPPYNNAASSSPPPSSTPFKPGIAVVVAVLTTMFSLTFLLLLYIKHCNGVNMDGGGNSVSRPVPPYSGRKNSGIDRCVVESLPIFRFGSLVGQKEGLDCAVCLTKFEAAEVLRLLPKCKHAFHVECVDTWLDAHSTCPLCRYRVDPEDILLVDNNPYSNSSKKKKKQNHHHQLRECVDLEKGRISDEIAESKRRHSSVGERGKNEEERRKTMSFRRSVDSATSAARKKNEGVGGIGCLARGRKDGMLLTEEESRISVERRLEHRIIVSPCGFINSGVQEFPHQRWSDVEAPDLLYLTSEMIMREGRGKYTRGGVRKKNKLEASCNDDVELVGGVINSRSVSEITGLSRFSSRGGNSINENRGGRRGDYYNYNRHEDEQGLVSRWLAWISNSPSQPAVR